MSSVAVDVSRFFLFEVTGDSSEVISSSVTEDFWADDDAQSCSCDSSDAQSIRLFSGEEERLGSSCCVENDGDDEEEEEEDGDEVNQSENRGGVGPQQKQNESSSKVQGGSVELVNEKDRDRLFWEACLAS
nr:CBL-interacting serine/threonine-protein kinase 7-like [Ipomoea batatas]